MDSLEQIRKKLFSFKRKYYFNLFLKGTIFTLAILTAYFLFAALLEYTLWLQPWGRLSIVLIFSGIALFCVALFLKKPLTFWLQKRGLGDEQSARLIGSLLPGVNDKLVNLIQLSRDSKDNSSLTYASVIQKSRQFEPISFETVIDLSENRKYLKYLLIPLGIILLLLIINSNILTQSTSRIVHFNQEYAPQAPFTFDLSESAPVAFFNEDYTLNVSIQGEVIPTTAYFISGSQRLKLDGLGDGLFQFTFEKIQEPKKFQVEAAGFYSKSYDIKIVNRPELINFDVQLEYPKYLGRKPESLANSGNLEIPEGTVVNWSLKTANANSASIAFEPDDKPERMQSPDKQAFTYKKSFTSPSRYEVRLKNEYSDNKDKILYTVDVVKDQYPQIAVNNFKDSVLYKRVVLGGTIADDYGVTQLQLEFHVKNSRQEEVLKKQVNIPITKNQLQQSYFFNWNVDSLKLKPGEQLEYFLSVWDNDGVNGRKSTRSAQYSFAVPGKDELITNISKSQSEAEQKISEGLDKAKKLQDQIDEASQKLKGKQDLDWQDKKKLEEILEQKKNLDQFINQLKDQNRLLEQKKDAFTEQDERIKEKAEQIQKLMEELLDEETRKLLEELEKLLQEKTDVNQLEKLLDKLNKNSQNLEKELERTLELFKQLQLEYKIDQLVQDLDRQVEEQEALKERTEQLEEKQDQDKKSKDNPKKSDEKSKGEDAETPSREKSESEKLAEEQENLAEDFKKTEEKMEEIKELREELDQNGKMPDQEQMEEIEQHQQNSQQELQENNPSDSKQQQQKAIQKMQEMKEQMQSMQNSMMMEMDMANIESLRQILHGLIKLSFDQENLMKQFGELNQNDPRFNTIAQQQLKLKDDAKVLEDSLLALSKRDEMMGSFITREITNLNDHLEKVIDANRERRRPQAASEMQLTMTSINNLALMLDSHFDMLMQMMAQAKGTMKKGKGKNQPKSLSQMQQMLNQRIQDLKNSGKSGRQLSEELAEMAAEQERIRRALQEMQQNIKQQGGHPGGDDIPGKMEETETELVNKQLTERLIQRQREILTRLLEAEKSMREQEMDEERKGETAKDYEKEMPKAIEEYLRLKEKEVELLKTVPPKLYPFYKKEVNEYFKRIGDNNF